MLTRKQKEEIVKNLSKEIADSKTVVICDFKGLSVVDISEVRKQLREKNAMMTVVKKTLAKIAFKEAGIEIDTNSMEGQLAFIYGGDDEVSGPKVAADFAKSNEDLKIVAGTLEGSVLTDKEMISLSKIPPKEELLAKLVGSLKSPISGFVGAMSGNLRNLVGVLNAVKESKE